MIYLWSSNRQAKAVSLMEFLIGYVGNHEPLMDAFLRHLSHQLFQALATALNGRVPFAGDPRRSLWEKLALEVVQEHCMDLLPGLNFPEMQARPDLARNHCLSQEEVYVLLG